MDLIFYKQNKIDNKYSMSVEEFVKQFKKAQERNEFLYKFVDFELALGRFVMRELDSVPENIPFTDEEMEAIFNEYTKEK